MRSETHHYVFGEEIVAEGAVVEVHLVEGLLGQLHHVTLVVTAVLVLAYHLLTHSQLVHGGFVALPEKKSHCYNTPTHQPWTTVHTGQRIPR